MFWRKKREVKAGDIIHYQLGENYYMTDSIRALLPLKPTKQVVYLTELGQIMKRSEFTLYEKLR